MPEKKIAQHFTYQAPESDDLCQGDIILKDGITHIIDTVHPHYLKNDYTHFIVLSQTCDLVRRGSPQCKTRYISIAAIRPLQLVLQRELDSVLTDLERESGLSSIKHYARIEDILRKIYDNNYPEYFYLHEDSGLGFHQRSCAFLRLSIALRATDHYEALKNARIASLNENFRAKLGWTVGQLYSRVGTPDWVPTPLNKQQFKDMIDQQLKELFVWVDKDKLDSANKNKAELVSKKAAGQKALADYILAQTVTPKKDRVLKAVRDVLINQGYVTEERVAIEISSILNNHPEIKTIKN